MSSFPITEAFFLALPNEEMSARDLNGIFMRFLRERKNIDYENGGYAKEGTMMALSCMVLTSSSSWKRPFFLKGQVIFDNDDQEQENKVD